MLQENLDCRPKNYKKVGTVQGIKIEEEDPLSPSNVKNSNLNWRETRKRKKDKIINQFWGFFSKLFVLHNIIIEIGVENIFIKYLIWHSTAFLHGINNKEYIGGVKISKINRIKASFICNM